MTGSEYVTIGYSTAIGVLVFCALHLMQKIKTLRAVIKTKDQTINLKDQIIKTLRESNACLDSHVTLATATCHQLTKKE